MRLFEQAEKYRSDMTRKLKKKYRDDKPPAVLEAEKVIAQYREEKASAELQIARLESKQCPSSVCFKCFWMKGLSFHLIAIPSDDETDLFRCPECNSIYEQKT